MDRARVSRAGEQAKTAGGVGVAELAGGVEAACQESGRRSPRAKVLAWETLPSARPRAEGGKLAERQLAPFGPRPHWGKIFTTPREDLRARYERLPDFLDLMRRFDPSGKFRNAYTARCLGL